MRLTFVSKFSIFLDPFILITLNLYVTNGQLFGQQLGVVRSVRFVPFRSAYHITYIDSKLFPSFSSYRLWRAALRGETIAQIREKRKEFLRYYII